MSPPTLCLAKVIGRRGCGGGSGRRLPAAGSFWNRLPARPTLLRVGPERDEPRPVDLPAPVGVDEGARVEVASPRFFVPSVRPRCKDARKWLYHPEPVQTQITAQPAETAVKSLAISPDGSYLAYAEKMGEGEKTIVKLRQKNNRRPATIPALVNSEIFRLSWMPDSATLLISGKPDPQKAAGIWLVPILAGGGPPVRVPIDGTEIGEAAAINQTQIAFVSGSRNEIWRTGIDGQQLERVLKGQAGDEFRDLVWLAGGYRLLFNRIHLAGTMYRVTAETLDLRTGQPPLVILDDPRLRAGCATPEGHIYFSLEHEPPNHNDTSLWEMSIDPQTGRVTREASMLVGSNGSNVYGLSTSADG